MAKKPVKISNLDEVLKNLPEEDREGLRAEILKLFENVDPENPPGDPVIPLAPGQVACEKCGGDLKCEHVYFDPLQKKQ
jgi:hypothetical protein